MTGYDRKILLFVQRYDGGLGSREVFLSPSLLALYDKRWSYEQAWGVFVGKQLIRTTDPYCLGSFRLVERGAPILEVRIGTAPFTPADVLYVVRRAFQDNRDQARLCRNPLVVVDGQTYGPASALR